MYHIISNLTVLLCSVTVWPSPQGGSSRDADGNLTDMIGELARDKADFGLYPCSLFSFDASEDDPVIFGPVVTSESFAIGTVYVKEDSRDHTGCL